MKSDQFVFSEVSSCVFIFANGERRVIRPESNEEIMMVKFRPPSYKNEFQENVIKYYLDSPTVPELAEKCGYDCLKSFTRHFKKHFNNTPYQWMLERRLEEARHYVIETDLSVTDISEICSFTNISHFVNLYTRQYGESPTRDRAYGRRRMAQ